MHLFEPYAARWGDIQRPNWLKGHLKPSGEPSENVICWIFHVGLAIIQSRLLRQLHVVDIVPLRERRSHVMLDASCAAWDNHSQPAR